MIQLLNIAGTGSIFGALMGAVFGPVVFLWIVFGSILGGAVHDYMSGTISSRHEGSSLAELSGTYLGSAVKWIMRVFSVILLVLCGTVFVTSPAGLLDTLTPGWMNGTFWAVIILIYYLVATLLPIDKLIGRLYPVFGVLLIVMAGASNVVYEISTGVLGVVGGILAVAGVIVCPITSGDTAFRSARLILAETFHLDQKKSGNRLIISIPLLAVGGLLTWFAFVNDNGFQIVWRYFSWSNQTLAMIALWVSTAYLLKKGKHRFGSLITAIPAAFMTAVSLTYILIAEEGFRLGQTVSYIAGISAAVILFVIYIIFLIKKKHNS